MICEHCKTSLPDDAVACWKCGTPTPKAQQSPNAKPKADVLHILASFFIAAVFFVCVGWTVPFTVFGMISTAANDLPQWASVSGIASGIILIGTAIAFIALTWWGAYWVITRLFPKSSGE